MLHYTEIKFSEKERRGSKKGGMRDKDNKKHPRDDELESARLIV